ncbi:MAG: hypothetical protein Q9165_006153 [Trypethelium subeluteriae]
MSISESSNVFDLSKSRVDDSIAMEFNDYTHSSSGNTGERLVEPIAIVGFSLKFPQEADNTSVFWQMLLERRCAMTDWPEDRLNPKAFLHPDGVKEDRKFVPGAHFVREHLGLFDRPFFNISAGEAVAMDPQQRILLELTFHALEQAGIPMEKLNGSRTGVYSGTISADYKQILMHDGEVLPKYTATGAAMNMVANRLSWFYNWTGPSVQLDSACSSSMMALDFAVQGLVNGASDAAIVTGSNLILAIEPLLTLMKMSLLSPDGRCFAFDRRANGYARGEGFGVIVLKRVDDAIRDGNVIRAVIRSIGSNQDGHTAGITQPSRDLQATLIRETYARASLDLQPVRYFEAHGTGTAVGDPIEADAIASVFRGVRAPEDPLYIGALKSNIGHLEGGAGIAGVIKAILVLEKALIPPNANFKEPNSRIDAEFANIKFPLEPTPWPAIGLRRASVNSFGFGGSNSHVIIDDACHFLQSRGLQASHCTVDVPPSGSASLSLDGGKPAGPMTRSTGASANDSLHVNESATEAPRSSTPLTGGLQNSDLERKNATQVQRNGKRPNGTDTESRSVHLGAVRGSPEAEWEPSLRLLVWSAADEGCLERIANAWQKKFLHPHIPDSMTEGIYLDRVSRILADGRSRLPWKAFALVKQVSDLAVGNKLLSPPVRSQNNHGLAFVFTGQGAQYNQVGIGLMVYPVFRVALEKFDNALQNLGCDWSLFDELSQSIPSERINEPHIAQPLTTAIQIALVELLCHFGLRPSAVLGHSSGEIAAAYAAGILSLESCCKVSYFRGRVVQDMKCSLKAAQAMMSVDLPEADMLAFLLNDRKVSEHSRLYVACINSPSNVTMSGDASEIDALKQELDVTGVSAQVLRVSVAYHTPLMSGVRKAYEASLTELEVGVERVPQQPTIIFSSVTGQQLDSLDVLRTAVYWGSNMVQQVRFWPALTQMLSPKGRLRRLGEPKRATIHDFVEIGPHSSLQRPIQSSLERAEGRETTRYSSVLSRRQDALSSTLNFVGKLWSLGYSINLDCVNQSQDSIEGYASVLVDLPPYPFNHSRKYWFESEMSKNNRIRIHDRHELLGVPVPDWNPLEPRWRKFFDSTETPWIGHHTINGRVMYPATGMLVMAIEGVKQLVGSQQKISAFHVKDALFLSPIMIESNEKTEVQLVFHPSDQPSNSTTHFEFRIYGCKGEKWLNHCQGEIQVLFQTPSVGFDKSLRLEDRDYHDKYAAQEILCLNSVDSGLFYDHLSKNGINYGSHFQALQNIHWDGQGSSRAEIALFRWNELQSRNAPQPHTAHPTTLDALGQLAMVVMTEGGTKMSLNGAVVTRIRSAWISTTGLSYPTEIEPLRAACMTRRTGLRGIDSSMFALSHSGQARLIVDHMELTLTSGVHALDEPLLKRKLCFGMDWKPDIDLMSSSNIVALCKSGCPDSESPVDFYRRLETCMKFFIRKTLNNAVTMDQTSMKPHLKMYIEWLKRQACYIAEPISYTNRRGITEAEIDDIINDLERTNAEGKLFVTMAQNLPAIIRGDKDPLDIMFGDERLAEMLYASLCKQISSCRQLFGFVDALAHKKPWMKILEIGAGTGSMTDFVLPPLVHQDSKGNRNCRFNAYWYTDVSGSFFERAHDKYADVKEKMIFKILDIEEDPLNQGYGAGDYDLVIAGLVLHATRNINTTLENIRKLLKPGGKLVLLETTNPIRSGFIWGTLPGWWLGEEEARRWSPCISEEQWHQALLATGFSGVDFELPDYEAELCHEMSVLVSTAVEEKSLSPEVKIKIVIDPDSEIQRKVANCLTEKDDVAADAAIFSSKDLPAISPCPDDLLIFLIEIGEPFLFNISEKDFNWLRDNLQKSRQIVWVTSADRTSPDNPQKALITGMARTFCSEMNDLLFVDLRLEDPTRGHQILASKINQVVDATLSRMHTGAETEYEERDGILMVNRVVEAKNSNEEIHERSGPIRASRELQHVQPVKVAIRNPGLLESLEFVEDVEVRAALASEEVEIEVKSVGVNFRDLLVVLGRIDTDSIGAECAGVVTRVGDHVATFSPGDRVCAVPAHRSCLQSFVRCDQDLVIKIPPDMSFTLAASLPVTAVTAHHCLVTIARLQRGESILIHAGAGGTGQMAIQVAQTCKAEIFATVGSEEKRQLLRNLYGLPNDHILYSRDQSFSKDIMRMTKGHGVDVVLNSLAGESLVASWECIATYERFIEIGKADIERNAKLPMLSFARNVSFNAVAIDKTCESRPSLIQPELSVVMGQIRLDNLKPVAPLHVFSLTRLEDALRFMQSGRSSGKMVLELRATDVIPTFLDFRPKWVLESEATYVISGGLGGLGRSAARWMAQRGAKNLILLSRSGPVSEASKSLLVDLHEMGVRVEAPRCDVGSAKSLGQALQQCSGMPRIRGCLQATMVLKDSIFQNMSFEDWSISFNSKIASSWNLHQLLPNDLSFFIMLSSAAGIVGTPGQANYCAGNTFQDALAHHRMRIGQTASSINLGWMSDVGIVSENPKLFQGHMSSNVLGLTERNFLALLDLICSPTQEINRDPFSIQPMLGFITPAQYQAKGKDVPPWAGRPLYSALPQVGVQDGSSQSVSAGTQSDTRDYASDFRQASCEDDALSILLESLLQKLGSALSISSHDFDPGTALHTYGVDSLLAVELRNWFGKVWKAEVSVFDITGLGSIKDLAVKAAKRSAMKASISS